MTRENILGLEAVLADGTVLSSMNRMIKNNAGYDLKHLFIGSEGTLGIVTRAVLRLREQPQSQLTALAALDSFDAIARFLKHMDRAVGGGLSAFEVMWRDFYEAVAAVVRPNGPPLPFGRAYYVVVEFLGADEDADRRRFEVALEQAFEAVLLADAVLASSSAQAREIWDIRDQSEHVESASGPTVTFDVSLPIGAMEAYVAKVQGELAAQGRRPGCFVFGHLGDGNLHFMVPAEPGSDADRHAVEAVVYGHLEALRGSVSAEHGIGLEKKAWLGHSRSPEELAVMRTLKRALDPKGILNPGKVFDP
jgi:FAD/FMN-containing dehydrogenase